MNKYISAFLTNHEDEINTDDFFSVFTSAHSELSNFDCEELYADLCQVFDPDLIMNQRSAAFRFILTMAIDDIDPSYTYTFENFFKNILANNLLGYDFEAAKDFIREEAKELDIEIYTLPSGIEKIRIAK